jgi:hypothetical protein
MSSRTRRIRTAAAFATAVALAVPGAALADKGHGSDNGNGHRDGNGHASRLTVTTTTATTTAATTAPPGSSLSARGIVQSVSTSTVVVKQLDGSVVSVPVDRRTHVFVNNKPTQWTDVRPGFVLVASWKAGKPAPILRFVRPT